MKKKTFKGVKCTPMFPFENVLHRWIKSNSYITESWSSVKDVPWWYNERAALSVFAGAIWQTNNFAFEEFMDDKRKISKRTGKFKNVYIGRIDLYFNIENQDFIAEGKLCYSGATSLKSKSDKKIAVRLDKACSDIRKTKPRGQRRLGIVFVCPEIKKKNKKEIDTCVKEWIGKIKNVKCDALAWIFPSKARYINNGEHYYPGTAVFIKEI